MRLNLRKLVPEHLGGSKDNIYNAIVERTWLNRIASWFCISPEYRPSLWRWIKGEYKKYYTPDKKKYGAPGVFRPRRKPLWDWVNKHKPKRILEIGLGNGANAKRMIELSEGCSYVCFDDLSMNNFKAYDELRRRPNTKFYIGDTMKTLPEFIDSLPEMDLIFIDGGHDYRTVKNDWDHCERLMHSSTACFFHDYDLLGPWRVVKEIQDEDRYSVKIIEPPVLLPVFALIEKNEG